MNSDAAHLALNKAIKTANNHLNNKGLTNFQIEEFFQNEENKEIKKNDIGVYSMDSITRYKLL